MSISSNFQATAKTAVLFIQPQHNVTIIGMHYVSTYYSLSFYLSAVALLVL